MGNVRELRREATDAELKMADLLESLAKRVRRGELNSVAYVALDSKESDQRYVLGQDGIGMLGAVQLLQHELTHVVADWRAS